MDERVVFESLVTPTPLYFLLNPFYCRRSSGPLVDLSHQRFGSSVCLCNQTLKTEVEHVPLCFPASDPLIYGRKSQVPRVQHQHVMFVFLQFLPVHQML